MGDPGLTLLGATGYTGRLCAAEAVRRGLPVRLAGRRRDALERLAAELGAGDTAVVDVGDHVGLARLARSSAVLLSTVGPYLRLGRPVVEAALAGGCHYLDISGEVPFLVWVRDQHDRAVAAGVALCPGFGLDGVPGDVLGAAAAARLASDAAATEGAGGEAEAGAGGVAEARAGGVAEARAAYLVRHVRVSAGTLRSALGMAAHGGAAWRAGAVVDEPVAAHRWRVPFPPPLGPRDAVSVPLPEAVTLGPSTGAATARAYAAVLGAGLLVPVAAPLDRLNRWLAHSPAWPLLERGLDWLPEGPPPGARAATRVAVLAEVRGPAGTRRAWVRMKDLYGTTAAIVVGAARRLLEPGPPRSGALTPSQLTAGEPVGALLDEAGADWSLL